MSLCKYLATALLAGAAFLYSPNTYAEDTQQNVAFNDSAAQARKTPNRNLEGKLNVSASRDKNKLVLEVNAENCQIRTGYSEFYIGLPGESEITELIQTAKVNERTPDGRGYEEKWIDLAPNEAFKKSALWIAEWGLGHVPIPLLSQAMGTVSDAKEARIQSWARQMKKKGLFMEELSPHYPKMPAAHSTNITRRYEMTLDVEPTKVPEARMQICLQDQYERTVTINDISVKFDEKAKVQIPKNIEALLPSDPELKLKYFYGPKEFSQLCQVQIKSEIYLIKQVYTIRADSPDFSSIKTGNIKLIPFDYTFEFLTLILHNENPGLREEFEKLIGEKSLEKGLLHRDEEYKMTYGHGIESGLEGKEFTVNTGILPSLDTDDMLLQIKENPELVEFRQTAMKRVREGFTKKVEVIQSHYKKIGGETNDPAFDIDRLFLSCKEQDEKYYKSIPILKK